MIGPILEATLILLSLWIIINVIHALITSSEREVSKSFFWLSDKIKRDNKGE